MKPLRFLLHATFAALFALAFAPARAAIDLVGDDTDLFTLNPNIPSQIPNVLFVIDNSPDWSRQSEGWPAVVDPACNAAGITGNTQGDAQLCAIYKTIANLNEQVNVGLMMFNDLNQGAYVRFPMKQMNSTNRTALQALLPMNVNSPGNKAASNSNYDNPMNDVFRYFNSFGTFIAPTAPAAAADAGGYTSSAETAFQFLAGTNANSCGYDYIIFIGNKFPNSSAIAPNIDTAAALLNDPAVVVNKTVLQTTGVNTDIWSRFLFQYGVKVGTGVYRHITTYTIDICNAHCDSNQATLLQSMATVSQGKYFRATTLAAIQTDLAQIFTEVQAVNSVFAATTLPVSINVRGTNLNQVYIGVFRPDPTRSPRWPGNLKQYKLGVANAATGQLELEDANSVSAVNLNTGFISNTATSIWTETSTFWSYRSPFVQTDAGGASDLPDGDLVEKGGAAEKIRQVYDFPDSTTAKTRNMYTCTGTCAAANPPTSQLKSFLFNAANTDITAAALGTFSSQNVNALTGTGTTATATINAGHTFVAGNSVIVSGAIPSYYNGTFTVLASPAPTATQFSYTVVPTPNATIDTTHAYVTFSTGNNTLTAGSDKITVTATPVDYNITSATLAGVLGNVNQLSYPLAGPTFPSTAATTFAVTGIRLVDNVVAAPGSSRVVWNSSTSRVTVTLTNHGYSTNDVVTISGAVQPVPPALIAGIPDAAFNVPGGLATGSITKVDNNTFTYLSNGSPAASPTVQTANAATADPNTGTDPFVWTSGQLVIICKNGFIQSVNGTTGAITTSCFTADNFDSSTSGVSISNVAGNTFDYTTSGNVSGPVVVPPPPFSAMRISTVDSHSYTVSSGSVASNVITLALGASVTKTVPGQLTHAFANGDTATVAGLVCRRSNGTACNCLTGSTSGIPAGNTYSVTATGGSATLLTFATSNQVASITTTGTTVAWNASAGTPSFSNAIAVSSLTPGTATVKALGTIYAAKSGDFTTRVTSITSQGNATGTITAALATAADPNERANLIAWVRGLDNRDDENKNGVATDVRALVHGDVLHSRPAVINYNRNADDNDVFIFYGANDGMLHAVKGGSLATGGGKEQWAFIPTEFFGKLKRLRERSPSISSFTPRDYFFDGPIGVYTLDANKDGKIVAADGDKVFLFIGMRRGGRILYALDVSDPLNPKLMWKRGCSEATGSGTAAGSGGCDAGFGEMGQTWSQPQLGYLKNWSSTLALMFAAGYDKPAEDPQSCFVTAWDATTVTAKTGVVPTIPMNTTNCPPSGGTSTVFNRTMGRGVYILNALTGDILWRVGPEATATRRVTGMTYAMPADLAVLKNRSNTAPRATDIGNENVPFGYLDRIYASDTGGTVWRIDVADASGTTTTPPNFVVTQLASIAVAPATGTHAALNYRKFLFSPDVVYSSDTTDYDAVLLGSGDREHAFDMVVQNRFYMFKDRNTGSLTSTAVPVASQPTPPTGVIADTSTSTDLFDVTNNCLQAAANCGSGQTQTIAQAALLAAKGWKLSLSITGEKTIATATTSAGSVIFNTNEPKQDTVTGTVGQCTSDLGTARQYAINFQNATATNIFSLPAQYVATGGRYAMFAGGGFLPTPVPVVVQIGGKYYQTVVAGVQTTNPGGLRLQSRLRTFWYKKVD